MRLVAGLVCLGISSGVTAANRKGTPQQRTFEVKHELTVHIPEGAEQVRIWFTLPQDEPAQQVHDLTIQAPLAHRIVRDSQENRLLYLEAQRPVAEAIHVVTTFLLTRSEVHSDLASENARPFTSQELAGMEPYLQPNQHVVIDDRIRQLSADIVGDTDNPVVAARRIYDWLLENADYWVKDPSQFKASPVGSTTYCLDTGTGNCSDFHSLYASLARAAGIPTRIVYGSLFKAELDGTDDDQSYHCWIDFYVPPLGWVPLDVALADIYFGNFALNDENEVLVNRTTPDGYRGPQPETVDYYFGNLDSRRVTWSRGRDLILQPRQAAGPVNALPKAYIEVDGQPLAEGTGWARKLTYRERR